MFSRGWVVDNWRGSSERGYLILGFVDWRPKFGFLIVE